MAITQGDTAGLTDTGELLLFVSIEDHRLGQLRLQRSHLLVGLPQLLPQVFALLLGVCQGVL
ncbi:MAG TPA: hypothetical protein VEL76_06545 [Gemmataceae bacterium]|nr:hypothetical protein [Gemmataceae bacterium]